MDYDLLHGTICFNSWNRMFLVKSDGSNLFNYSAAYYEACENPQFCPDGNKIIYTKTSNIIPIWDKYEIFIINTDGTENIRIFNSGPEPIYGLTFTPNNQIVFLRYNSIFYQMDYNEGKLSNLQLLENVNKFSFVITVICASGLVIIVLKDASKFRKKDEPQKKENIPPPQS